MSQGSLHPELSSVLITKFMESYRYSIQHREYELQVNNIEEIKQRLVELRQNSNQHLSENMRFSCSMFF